MFSKYIIVVVRVRRDLYTTKVFTCSSPCFAFFGGDDEVVVDALGRFLLEFLTGEGVMLSRFSSTSSRLL